MLSFYPIGTENISTRCQSEFWDMFASTGLDDRWKVLFLSVLGENWATKYFAASTNDDLTGSLMSRQMIICRGFVVVVCVTAKYSDHMCVWAAVPPSDSLAALSVSSGNFSCVPWRAQIIYIIYKPFNNNMSRNKRNADSIIQSEYLRANPFDWIFTCASGSVDTLCCSKLRSSSTSRSPRTHSCNTENLLLLVKMWFQKKTLDHNILLTHCFFLLSEISPLYFSVRFSTFEFNLRIFFSCRVMSSSMVTK